MELVESLPTNHVEEEHVSLDDLRIVLETASSPPNRSTVWRHFAARCPRCWSRARALTGSCPQPGAHAAEVGDPLALAIGDLVLSSGADDRQKAYATRWLFPAHRFAIRRLAIEPLSFVRVYLERVDLAVTDSPDLSRAFDLSQKALQEISLPELRNLAPAVYQDLRSLARARLAACHAARNQLDETWSELKKAKKERASGTGDPEIEASLTEIEAATRLRHDPAFGGGQAFALLGHVGGRLMRRKPPIAGRRALTLVHQASVAIALECHEQALALLGEALAEAPLPLGRLNVEIHHRQTGILNILGRSATTCEILGGLQTLDIEDYLPRRIRARGDWLLGVALLQEGRLSEAEGHLIDARTVYQKLGMWASLFDTLYALAKLFLLQGKTADEIGKLFEPFAHLSYRDDCPPILDRYYRQLRTAALKAGVPMPWLEQSIQEMEALGKEPN